MTPGLNLQVRPSREILITEDPSTKKWAIKVGIVEPGYEMIRRGVSSGNLEIIPPIFALQFPYDVETCMQRHADYVSNGPRFKRFGREPEVLVRLLEADPLPWVCYNGNKRLEVFQESDLPMRAFVITNDSEFDQIPVLERRRLFSLPVLTEKYPDCFIELLDAAVRIEAKKLQREDMWRKLNESS